jgi:hypothetical protein
MNPVYKAHMKNFGIGAAGAAGGIFGTFLGQVMWSTIRIGMEQRRETKRREEELLIMIERNKRDIILKQKEVEALVASGPVVYPPTGQSGLYKQFQDAVAEEVTHRSNEKESPTVSGEVLSDLGPFWGHDIFIHEDTQPEGKTRGDGCTFYIWDWKKELEERAILRGSGAHHLTQKEFEENEYGFQQHWCSYYVDTNVLVDEDGVEYPWSAANGFEEIGSLTSVIWGRGANRSDTIYLRNELVEAEYMIVREDEMTHLQLAVGERDGDDLNDLEGHKDPKGF